MDGLLVPRIAASGWPHPVPRGRAAAAGLRPPRSAASRFTYQASRHQPLPSTIPRPCENNTLNPRSYVEARETSLVWSYRHADPEFGRLQARDLLQVRAGGLTRACVCVCVCVCVFLCSCVPCSCVLVPVSVFAHVCARACVSWCRHTYTHTPAPPRTRSTCGRGQSPTPPLRSSRAAAA